jgi:uncharacterized membrane protein YdbT with pleckstrin-like domain
MKQLDSKAIWLFILNSPLFLGAVVFILLFFFNLTVKFDNLNEFPFDLTNFILIAIPVFFIVSFVLAKLTYHFYRYELTDTSFKKEHGIIYKKYVAIPYDKIQNVDIYRGILHRVLGLSDLNIQTAGSSAIVNHNDTTSGTGAEARLPALSKEVAEQLRDDLIRRASQSKNQGL